MSDPVIRRFQLPNGDTIVSLREDVLRSAVSAAGHSLREELARFNAERAALLGNMPINPTEDRMPLQRSGVGGDVEEPE